MESSPPISSSSGLVIIRLCSFCKHDLGLRFNCPQCHQDQDLPFSYLAQNRIFCEDCAEGEVQSPLLITCTSPDEEGIHHVCLRRIRTGTAIEEVNPISRQIERSYSLSEDQNLYPNNVADTYYLEGALRICRYCRYIPANIGRDHPEVLLAMLCESDMERVIKEYYEIFPILTKLYPLETRRGIPAEDWVDRIREVVITEMTKNLKRNPLLFTRKKEELRSIAVEAEKKLYFDIICKEFFAEDLED